MWGQLSTTYSNLLKSPNGEFLVAVDHNQLRTMASETVSPIDWSQPPPYTGQYPLSSTYCTVQCGLQITRLATLTEMRTCDLRNARPTHCLCGHSGYKIEYIPVLLLKHLSVEMQSAFESFKMRYGSYLHNIKKTWSETNKLLKPNTVVGSH